jgi:hypothetical protein
VTLPLLRRADAFDKTFARVIELRVLLTRHWEAQ